jgi:hypothetical protein
MANLVEIYSTPPKRSATAPVRRPPTISTTRMSEFEETLAIESRRDNVSTRKNLNQSNARKSELIIFTSRY